MGTGGAEAGGELKKQREVSNLSNLCTQLHPCGLWRLLGTTWGCLLAKLRLGYWKNNPYGSLRAIRGKVWLRGSLPPSRIWAADGDSGSGCAEVVPATPWIGSGASLRVTFPGCEVDRGIPAVVAQEGAHRWEGRARPLCSPVGHLQFHGVRTSDKAALRPPSNEAETRRPRNRA